MRYGIHNFVRAPSISRPSTGKIIRTFSPLAHGLLSFSASCSSRAQTQKDDNCRSARPRARGPHGRQGERGRPRSRPSLHSRDLARAPPRASVPPVDQQHQPGERVEAWVWMWIVGGERASERRAHNSNASAPLFAPGCMNSGAIQPVPSTPPSGYIDIECGSSP
jgi:hypothetical protein